MMSRVFVITEKIKKDNEIHSKNRIVGVVSKLPNRLPKTFSSYSIELDDPELLNRIARKESKMSRVYLCEDVTFGEIIDFIGDGAREYRVKIDMLTNTDELNYEISQVAVDSEHELIEIGIK